MGYLLAPALYNFLLVSFPRRTVLGKTVFHLVGLDSTGRVVIRKRCSRTQLLAFTANLQVQLRTFPISAVAHDLAP
jgi:hypothetical protein